MESTLLGHGSDWWNGAMLISLGLAALVAFSVAAATAGVIIVQKREAETSKAELERYKFGVAAQVADAKREGIEAGKAAGDANLKAAEANERAAALEKEAEQLRASNLVLAAKIAPRRLSSDQSRKIITLLAGKPHFPIAIVSRLLDPEGKDFGDDLEAAFTSAGWHVTRVLNWTKSDKGLFVAAVVGSKDAIPSELGTALEAANIKYAGITISDEKDLRTMSPWFQPNILYILVGAHP